MRHGGGGANMRGIMAKYSHYAPTRPAEPETPATPRPEVEARPPRPERQRRPFRALRSLLWLYLLIGLGFGLARFGWGAVVAAAAEPEAGAFTSALLASAVDGLIRIVAWAPTLVTDVLMAGGDFFQWMLYA